MANPETDKTEFDGAKLALFLGDDLLVIRRDAAMDVTWAGCLDWPGGGRDPGENPVETVLRETREEVGLILSEGAIELADTTERLGVRVLKFVARLDASFVDQVRLGDEGQAWGLMTPQAFANHPDAVPSLVVFLRETLGLGWPDTADKVACRTPAEGRAGVTNIPAWKYNLMRGWLRELVLRAGPEGLLFKGLADQVGPLLHEADRARLGSVGWHLTTVKLEMEVRGELARRPGKGPQRIVPGPTFLDVVTGDVPHCSQK